MVERGDASVVAVGCCAGHDRDVSQLFASGVKQLRPSYTRPVRTWLVNKLNRVPYFFNGFFYKLGVKNEMNRGTELNVYGKKCLRREKGEWCVI